MSSLTIDKVRCKGCELCTDICPKGILSLSLDEITDKGYHPVKVDKIEECTGCASCAIICPDVAIRVERQ